MEKIKTVLKRIWETIVRGFRLSYTKYSEVGDEDKMLKIVATIIRYAIYAFVWIMFAAAVFAIWLGIAMAGAIFGGLTDGATAGYRYRRRRYY